MTAKKTTHSTLTILIIAFLCGSPSLATPEIRVEFGHTGITFISPPGFHFLTEEEISVKWPNRNAPRFALGNDRGTTTIAYDIKDIDLSTHDIDDIRGSIATRFQQSIPMIEWRRNEVIRRQGQDWIYLEMTSRATDTDIHNIILITEFWKKMLIFNFNSTRSDFPIYEQQLKKSIESIRLPTKTGTTARKPGIIDRLTP